MPRPFAASISMALTPLPIFWISVGCGAGAKIRAVSGLSTCHSTSTSGSRMLKRRSSLSGHSSTPSGCSFSTRALLPSKWRTTFNETSLFKEFAGGEGQGLRAKRFLDAQAFVPFRHALGAREAADLELAHAPAHREVHDGDIFRFARARRDDGAVAGLARGVPAGERLGERADLVRLEEHGVARAVRALHPVGRGDEEIVAHDLDGSRLRKGAHRVGIVLGERILG